MAGTGELSERKAAILRDLVHQFIRTGEPVGSEALASVSRLGISSATIRNELAALEEMGYLTQPHTSAGRMPTVRGYRYFVNMLPARARLREQERRAVVQFFDEALADVDDILRGTTQLLSRLTRYAALALAPSLRESTVARAELVRLGTSTLLLLVFENGQIEKRLVDLPVEAGEEDVERLSRRVLETIRGRNVREAQTLAATMGADAAEPDATAFRGVADALHSIEETVAADHVVLGGMANIAAEEAFVRRDTLRGMLEALERESEVLRLLREAAAQPQVRVTIGHEDPVTGMWEASMVAAPYAAGGRAIGTIGVVGPLRMDYAAAMSVVRAVADRLSAVVDALGG
jgi:heat-inducible transcriptional repressor